MDSPQPAAAEGARPPDDDIVRRRLEALGVQAASVASEFNNCLTGILGYATLLQRKLPADDPLLRYADAIEKLGRRAAERTATLVAQATGEEPIGALPRLFDEPAGPSLLIGPRGTADPDAPRSAEPSPPALARVLVADDHRHVRETVRSILEDAGYEVVTANDGEEALRLYESARPPIDLVLLDLMMPGIGGAETFRRLASFDASARVILSSGYGDHLDVGALGEGRPPGLLHKPYRLEDLLEAVRSALASS